jgi:hypothetical protein
MAKTPKPVERKNKLREPKARDQSHKPARHIEETARLASSVETVKKPGKVQEATFAKSTTRTRPV